MAVCLSIWLTSYLSLTLPMHRPFRLRLLLSFVTVCPSLHACLFFAMSLSLSLYVSLSVVISIFLHGSRYLSPSLTIPLCIHLYVCPSVSMSYRPSAYVSERLRAPGNGKANFRGLIQS